MLESLLLIIGKISPLYGIVAGGYVAANRFEMQRESLASMLIYVVTPVVFFGGLVSAPLKSTDFMLTVLFFVIGCVISLGFFWASRNRLPHEERSILAFAAGAANTGYFGIPLISAVLGPDYVYVPILVSIGVDLFEYTLGYYLMARHQASGKEALKKVLKSPALWAFALGITCVGFHVQMPAAVLQVIDYFKGTYIILGMVLLGLSLVAVRQKQRGAVDKRFMSWTWAAKFIAFPTIVATVVLLDAKFLHMFSSEVHAAMLLLSVVPLASDTVAFATHLKLNAEKAAVTVLASTVFALPYAPVLAMFIKHYL